MQKTEAAVQGERTDSRDPKQGRGVGGQQAQGGDLEGGEKEMGQGTHGGMAPLSSHSCVMHCQFVECAKNVHVYRTVTAFENDKGGGGGMNACMSAAIQVAVR